MTWLRRMIQRSIVDYILRTSMENGCLFEGERRRIQKMNTEKKDDKSRYKNATDKAEKDQRKDWNIQEVLGGMDQNEQMVLSYFIHTSLQKGRLIGWKEKEGVKAEEIADILNVPVDVVQKALDEDPYDILGITKE